MNKELEQLDTFVSEYIETFATIYEKGKFAQKMGLILPPDIQKIFDKLEHNELTQKSN